MDDKIKQLKFFIDHDNINKSIKDEIYEVLNNHELRSRKKLLIELDTYTKYMSPLTLTCIECIRAELTLLENSVSKNINIIIKLQRWYKRNKIKNKKL